jgi:hypothetical protein
MIVGGIALSCIFVGLVAYFKHGDQFESKFSGQKHHPTSLVYFDAEVDSGNAVFWWDDGFEGTSMSANINSYVVSQDA